MTSAYLFLGPESIGWMSAGNQLFSPAKASSFPDIADKIAFIELHLAETSCSSMHLVIGNSLEEVNWQSSESRNKSFSAGSTQRSTRKAMHSQNRESLPAFGRQTHKLSNAGQRLSVDSMAAPSTATQSATNVGGGSESFGSKSVGRKAVEAGLVGRKSIVSDWAANNSQTIDPFRTRQQFSATRQRKLQFTSEHVCPQLPAPGKRRKLIREFECAVHPDTHEWHRAAALLSSRDPLLISHTLLVESLHRSKGLRQTSLLVVGLEDGYERHIYMSAGMVCLSRLVAVDPLEPDDDQFRSNTKDTLQHISRMRAEKIRSEVDKESPVTVQPVDLWCNPLIPEQSLSEVKNAEMCVHEFLEKHIGEPTLSMSSVVPSTVLKSVVLENHFITARKRGLQQQSRRTLVRGAIGFSLTGLLLWQLTQLHGKHRDVQASEAQLLLDQAELNRLQELQSTRSDSEWHSDRVAGGFESQQMKYVVEAGRAMHKHSILFPAACLLRIQEIKAGTPAVSLNRIEWRSDNDGMYSQYQEPRSEAPGLLIHLSGQIDPSLSADSGLKRFESFVQSLINGFNLQAVDEVRYPFGADPHGQIRSGSTDVQANQGDDRKNFVETTVPENAYSAFEIKITVSQSSVSELILMVESLVPEV